MVLLYNVGGMTDANISGGLIVAQIVYSTSHMMIPFDAHVVLMVWCMHHGRCKLGQVVQCKINSVRNIQNHCCYVLWEVGVLLKIRCSRSSCQWFCDVHAFGDWSVLGVRECLYKQASSWSGCTAEYLWLVAYCRPCWIMLQTPGCYAAGPPARMPPGRYLLKRQFENRLFWSSIKSHGLKAPSNIGSISSTTSSTLYPIWHFFE